ncbi:MAG: hypothetical protein AAFW47_03035 [Pseudomonadota bacterium]
MLLSAILIGGLIVMMLWDSPLWPAWLSWVLIPPAIAVTVWWYGVPESFADTSLVAVLWAATAMTVAFFGTIFAWPYIIAESKGDASGQKSTTAEARSRGLKFFIDPTGLDEKMKARGRR